MSALQHGREVVLFDEVSFQIDVGMFYAQGGMAPSEQRGRTLRRPRRRAVSHRQVRAALGAILCAV